MSLKKYKEKRDFDKTTEPKSSAANLKKPLNFCIQKHDARNLHYDFRLEFNGILLSWAVPKGPSIDSQDKRLAIHVEDHPLDYQYFEGTIPKGNYGSGTVEIWDHGTYTTPSSNSREEIEKEISLGMKKGHLAIILHGERLNGEFILEKLKKQEPDDQSWLLIKKNESHSEKKSLKKAGKKEIKPDFIPPMLATLIDKPFDDEQWCFEIKWDGFRVLSFITPKSASLKSRNNLSFDHKFPSIKNILSKIKSDLILDGEIVVVDKNGNPDFQLIQNYQSSDDNKLFYYVFDILYKDGEDLRDLPLEERKEILKKIIDKLSSPQVIFSDHIIGQGKAFYKVAQKEKLEGIIGKKLNSPYVSTRSRDWVKIKNIQTQEFIICGFTEPKGSRQKFGSLIAGIYNDAKELVFAGHIGTGFDDKLLKTLSEKFKPLITTKCPFKNKPKVNMPVTWLKPKLIGEVNFTEWTKDKIMRHPVFKGLRDDKDKTTDVKMELPEVIKPKKIKNISLTHLEKIYWPDKKITKGDLINYYEKIAPYILPYLKNRPIMLHRYPEGISGIDFYQKDLKATLPKGIETYPLTQEGKINHYLLINNLSSLLYAINLGSIDLHPFLSRIDHLDNPDFCVIDLDPHDIDFQKVIEVALVVHEILDNAKVTHFCKTSGGKGLHVLIPLHGHYTFDQSRSFAEIICHLVHQRLPKTTSLERSPRKRPKKIYLDCLQNRSNQSIVAPYSVRPRPDALVSTPLEWHEVNENLDIHQFDMKTTISRLEKIGDILKPLLGKGINMKKAITFLNS